jgi:hypothetical protein
MAIVELICDGCGQAAGQEHIARRLKRLENMTRYRPVHIQTLFLAAVSPMQDADHLYSADGSFLGEGATLLRALDIEPNGRSIKAVLSDFQRRGYLLTYVLECPIEASDEQQRAKALETRVGAMAARIRRSFKPKRVVILGEEMDHLVAKLTSESVGAQVLVPEIGRAFRLEEFDRFVTAVTATGAGSLC